MKVKKILKLWLVNILWVICSIPLITIGASTAAAFYVTLKLVDDPDAVNSLPVCKQFFKGFKDNFKQGTAMWIITLITIGGCVYFWYWISQNDTGIVIKGLAVVCSIIALVLNLYAYPLMARYSNSLLMTIKNSAGISIQYLYSTVVISLLVAVEIIVILLNKWTMLAGILVGPELVFFTISTFAKKTFLAVENIVPEETSEEESSETED